MKDNLDPRDIDYVRVHNKAKINKVKLFIIVSIYISCIIIFIKFNLHLSLIIIFSLLYLIINLKNLVLLIVKIYQNVAPISIRDKCRFEPSCSDYMIMSINKYGLIKGLKKGINRLKRCNINDGGYDYP